MSINELTIGQAKELAAMFGGTADAPSPHIGKKCIIRTYASGVHYGTLAAHSDRQVELTNARRLWRWFALNGISLSEVSQNGIDAARSKVCMTVPTMTVLDALEIIPTSDNAAATIEGAEVYRL